ncbi:MAG: nitroreductase family deazaflavin-dependent oxidoreductase [Actinomycetota bacterium]|nr:nitroreductase family deazaflavin-dependent oxidoreductase [Actinomycetota bacterium]
MDSECTGEAPSAPEAIANALATDLTVDITTIGRVSGKPRRIEIWYLRVDGQYYITGTPRPRDWLANLIANPRLTFHLKESTLADLDAEATVVTDPDERRRVLSSTAAKWYRGQVDLDRLLAEAPMVRITFPSLL